MLRILVVFLSLFMTSFAFGQFPPSFGNKGPKINGQISGKIIDSVSQEVVMFATITLKKAGRDKLVDGVLSDEFGKFKFKEVKTGKYDVQLSFLGYADKLITIELTPEKPDVNLGLIQFATAINLLDEVEITDQRSLIENKVDKLVYNAEQDASISGGDAADVLRNVPLLSVDLDGNVSLRGSQNVKILINGKPSGMFAASVSDALKTIPADQIKKVEVITSPTAKYDAEGSGGIINIITKKSVAEGLAGSVNGSTGTRQDNLVLNLSTAKGRMGFNVNGSVYSSIPANASVDFTREDTLTSGEVRTLEQYGNTLTDRTAYSGSGSAYYDFNAFNSLNTSFRYNGFNLGSNGTTSVRFSDPLLMLESNFERDAFSDNLFAGYDWNLDYKKTFADSDKEFVLASQISGNINNIYSELYETFENGVVLRDEIINNDGDNLETTIQADYTHPFKKGVKMEVGAKTVLRDIDSYYTYSLKDPSSGNYIVDPARQNTFFYHQDILAAYASFNYVLFKKYSINTGIRAEHTSIYGDYESGKKLEPFQYLNVLPNIIISRSLKNFKTIKLSYNQRIQRPSLYYVNPFVNSSDTYNITIGNPILTPEITHQIDLSYNTFFKGFAVFSSIFYKYGEDIIQNLVEIKDDGVSENSYYNVGTNNSFGLNIFGTKSIKSLTLRGGGNVNTYSYASSLPEITVSNPFGFVYSATVVGSYNFPYNLKMDMFGFFRSSNRTIQGSQPSFSIFGMGFKKEFPKLKASVGLRIIEPFFENKVFESNQTGAGFYQESSFSIPFRSIGFNLEYRFGEVKFKERKSAIKNEDLKQQEDNSGGGGGGNMGNG